MTGGVRQRSIWWAPQRASWWIAILFSVGSICFLVGPFPGFVNLVGAAADGLIFFVGSIFFTSAALLQYLVTASSDHALGDLEKRGSRIPTFEPRRIDWWSAAIQLVGTLYFNVDTYRAMQEGIDSGSVDRLIWTPDALGSLCFLVSGALAYLEVRGAGIFRATRTLEWWIAIVNLVGCVFFAISAIASYVVPKTGDVLDLAAANATTSLGALCFLIGAVMLLPEAARTPERSSTPAPAPG
jgi:hypothetical protein